MQRPHVQDAADLVRMLRAYRPCPQCDSPRVTVRRLTPTDAPQAICSECGAEHTQPAKVEPA